MHIFEASHLAMLTRLRSHDQGVLCGTMTSLWNIVGFSLQSLMFSSFFFFYFSLKFNQSGIICAFVFSKSLAYNVESESSNQYIKQGKKTFLILL